MDAMGVSTDVLHAPLGLLAYLVFTWLLRRKPLGPLLALPPVAALQGLNEVLDARDL